jgi:hypothetical protein
VAETMGEGAVPSELVGAEGDKRGGSGEGQGNPAAGPRDYPGADEQRDVISLTV